MPRPLWAGSRDDAVLGPGLGVSFIHICPRGDTGVRAQLSLGLPTPTPSSNRAAARPTVGSGAAPQGGRFSERKPNASRLRR